VTAPAGALSLSVKNARAQKIAPKMICRFCIGEFSPLMIWFAVNVIWFAVGPRPRSRAPPFVCLGLPIRFARVTEIAGDCQNEYETLKPQKETVAAVMSHRVFHPSPRKNLSSLG